MRVDLACYLRQYARPERLRIGGWACAAAIQGQGCVVHEFSWSKEASSTSCRSTCFFPVVAAARSEARARLLMRRSTPRVFSKQGAEESGACPGGAQPAVEVIGCFLFGEGGERSADSQALMQGGELGLRERI